MASQGTSAADALDRDVRIYVFRQSADTAHVPTPVDIARALGSSQEEIENSVRRLAAARVLILAPGTTNIWAANPFCATPSNFRVEALGRTYWGICIWDALGIPAALHTDATVTARCGDCDQDLILEVRGDTLVQADGIVHFGVPAKRWWENIAFT